MSIAFAKPSAEQFSKPPCRSSFGAHAMECTRTSSRPHSFSMRANTASSSPGCDDVERHEDGRLQLACERLDVALGLLVEVGDGQVRAELVKRLGAAVGDRMLVGDAADQHLRVLQYRTADLGCVMVTLLEGLSLSARCCSFSGMARDHQFFVGGDHPHRDLAGRRADARPAGLVGRRIELHAQPRRVAADALAYRRRMLADARGEDQRVDAAGRRGKRPEFAPDAGR